MHICLQAYTFVALRPVPLDVPSRYTFAAHASERLGLHLEYKCASAQQLN